MKARIIPIVLGGSFMFLLGQASATKPTVSTPSQVERADLIVVGTIDESRTVQKPRQNAAGEWLPARKRAVVKVDEVLKMDLPPKLEFDVGDLTLEPGKRFVLFLEAKPATVKTEQGDRRAVVWDYLAAPAQRVPATAESIKQIKQVVKR